jgi:membrane protein DedA with SNARE-associated domain
MEQAIQDFAHAFSAHAAAVMPLLEHYGYAGIFVAVLVEGFGIPSPGQTLLILGALLAAQAKLNIVTVVAVAWCATVIGNVIGYAIGRRAGRRLLLAIGVGSQRIARVEDFVRRYGPAIIIIARFVDGLRQLSSIVAGSMGMPWRSFLTFVLIGATLWAGVIGIGAYYLERDFHAIAGFFVHLEPYGWIITGGLILALLVYLLQQRKPV